MQQAARVSDMTAFFSSRWGRRERAPRHPRRVRPDLQGVHQPVRQADGGLRHGAVRVDRDGTGRVSTKSRRARGEVSRSRAPSCSVRCAPLSACCSRRTSSSATRSSRSTTRSTRATTASRRWSRRCSRSSRPSPPTCVSYSDPAQLDPSRAHRRPVRHGREADQAGGRAEAGARPRRGPDGDGGTGGGDGAHRARLVLGAGRRARAVTRRAGRAHRPHEPAGSPTRCWRSLNAPGLAGVGDADDRRRTLSRARRRQRRGHRRADRVRRHREFHKFTDASH